MTVKNDSIQISFQELRVPSVIYYSWNNIIIPKPFEIIDSLRLKKTESNLYDVILVLGIKNTETDSRFQDVHERLLVFVKQTSKKYKLISVNRNAIPADDEYPNESFKAIKQEENNIILKFVTGSSRKCNYTFYFKKYAKRFILSKLSLECYLIDLSREKRRNIFYSFTTRYDLRVINLRRIIEKLNGNIYL